MAHQRHSSMCLLFLWDTINIFDYIYNIQIYNFACCFIWVWNLVSQINSKPLAEGIWEQGSEEYVWA